MSNNKIWLGYLNIGDKSSPVVRDDRLNTGNPQTVYLFNLKRNSIIEYRRDIIEPKLRELSAAETDEYSKDLNKAFNDARTGFVPRISKNVNIPERATGSSSQKKNNDDDMDVDVDNDDMDMDDMDED